ncbi:tumor necrosis factor receptor superfamily member 13B-like [Micropterus salmoides]|uniref:tumor necrosis factor receptor superfamily member 13B-like n=1 Tax=Micropterus salmoides TaxID=27706 RepID=UPI0018EDACA5|nr:tumor necrosis factor receptor superfamily member 13B-like [Micropterus salmoides]
MGRECLPGQYWDSLVKECMNCSKICQQAHISSRCTSYCEYANCKALPGHFYDGLLKKCMRCAELCGRHPAECSQHCSIPSHVPGTVVPTALEESSILLYSLLALSMVLLFSSLALAMAVLLKRSRAKTSNLRTKEADHKQESVVQPGQEVGQSGYYASDFVTNSSRLTDREPSDECSPTETCVCVHCFPDLKALGQGNDRLHRAPFSLYSPPFLQRAQMQKEDPLWTQVDLYTDGMEVHEEAAVG